MALTANPNSPRCGAAASPDAIPSAAPLFLKKLMIALGVLAAPGVVWIFYQAFPVFWGWVTG